MEKLNKYQFDLNASAYEVREIFPNTNVMRYGVKTFNQREIQAAGSAHNYERMELKPVGWKLGDRTVTCLVPHEAHFITQWRLFCYHSRMKDYGPQAKKVGLHLPQSLISAIGETESVRMQLRNSVSQYWAKNRGKAVPQALSVQLCKGWIDKFGEPLVSFDIALDKETNCLHVESSIKIRAGLSMSFAEGKVLRDYLAYASQVACECVAMCQERGR